METQLHAVVLFHPLRFLFGLSVLDSHPDCPITRPLVDTLWDQASWPRAGPGDRRRGVREAEKR